ncbi:MAG: YihY/virulence factor BrkB family protein [Armatimonadetes bacterium]|nr:YihY/virulence factor BrkB family protein [Armatimonadota bacterium]
MKPRISELYRFLSEVFHEYGDDQGSLAAAAMAFFGLLSLLPLLLLAIGVFGRVLGSQEAYDQVLRFITSYAPAGTENLTQNLDTIRESSHLFSGLGLLALLWAGSSIFVILQHAMNIALGLKRRLNYFALRLRALALVLASGVLFALSVGTTWALTAVRTFDAPILGLQSVEFDPFWNLVATLIPIATSMLMFFLIYKFLPAAKTGIRGPLAAGVTAGLLFELAKWGFGVYLRSFANFSVVYGSIAGVIIAVLWIYYVSMITVFCAEIASVVRKREQHMVDRTTI